MKLTIILVLLLSLTGICFSAGSDVGTTMAQSLKLGAGARPAGMGDVFTGICDDASAIYWNLAGLNGIEEISFSLAHSLLSTDSNYEFASYVQPTKLGVFGLGVQYISYGSISETDNSGNETGSFSPIDMSIVLAYSFNLFGVSLGAGIKQISSQIKNTVTATAIDLGGKYGSEHISMGLSVQNVGVTSGEDLLPLNIRAGVSCKIKDNWLCALDVNVPSDNDISFGLGTEYNYKINEKMNLAGRAGYNTGTNNLAIGFGWSRLVYSIDYAYVPAGTLGATQKISLSVRF